MIWSMIRYIKGYLLIRVEGYSPERFLNACSHRGIELWGLRSAGGAYEMYMTLKDFRKIKALSKKTGTKVRVRRRYGLPFFYTDTGSGSCSLQVPFLRCALSIFSPSLYGR